MKDLVLELINTSSCCEELKDSCKKYLDSLGTKKEGSLLNSLIETVKESVTSIDDLIDFLDSDMGEKVFGKTKCKEMLKHSLEEKEKGEKYCDCPACTAARKILDYIK